MEVVVSNSDLVVLLPVFSDLDVLQTVALDVAVVNLGVGQEQVEDQVWHPSQCLLVAERVGLDPTTQVKGTGKQVLVRPVDAETERLSPPVVQVEFRRTGAKQFRNGDTPSVILGLLGNLYQWVAHLHS